MTSVENTFCIYHIGIVYPRYVSIDVLLSSISFGIVYDKYHTHMASPPCVSIDVLIGSTSFGIVDDKYHTHAACPRRNVSIDDVLSQIYVETVSCIHHTHEA